MHLNLFALHRVYDAVSDVTIIRPLVLGLEGNPGTVVISSLKSSQCVCVCVCVSE